MAWPQITVGGTPHEQGLAHGHRLAPLVAHNLALYFSRFREEAGLSREEVLAMADPYLEALRIGHPGYHAGMEGIATGSGQPLLDIAALNVRYEILYSAHTKALLADGCTAAALLPEAT
ncbi:peptidase C45, partial [bacterium]|nr:peptidase C45 [bacterium]